MASNRRRFVRVPTRLRFTFAWDQARFELFTVEDLSASGARLKGHRPPLTLPPLGAEGTCTFALDAEELAVPARVSRLTREGFAVRFLGLTPTQEDHLVAWVFRKEAQALARRHPD